ncbi:DMT family transporter [Nocardiopsis halophila]|uniref:DMT family transporter n=1 Tax=Nocardiopsis halophila TaxID=141692 RepID=UPI00034984ED|nr:multidrug efflux SMR transporter [Nocardiopsis halophila]
MSTGTAADTRRSPAASWTVLAVAGLLEIVWSLALKKAEGLTRPGWGALGIGTALLSLGLLSTALKDLPMGTAYAAWVGIGTIGVAAAGIIAHGEPVTAARLALLGLIIGGVVTLSLSDHTSERTPADPPRRPTWHG